MAKVQQKTSLCKKKSCNCGSYEELTRIKQTLRQTAKELYYTCDDDPVSIIERIKSGVRCEALLKELYRNDVEKLEQELRKYKPDVCKVRHLRVV
jgi:hypothetical protein